MFLAILRARDSAPAPITPSDEEEGGGVPIAHFGHCLHHLFSSLQTPMIMTLQLGLHLDFTRLLFT